MEKTDFKSLDKINRFLENMEKNWFLGSLNFKISSHRIQSYVELSAQHKS